MGTVGLPENSPPPGSALRLPTTPLCASTTGSGRRHWPTTARPSLCMRSSTAMPRSAIDLFAPSYHWSFMQVEYATDLVFRSQAVLKPLYEQLSRQAILTVKAEHVATFLGHKITPQLAQEIGSQFATRIEGTCLEHRFG